jgi:hypothetical protein
MVDEITQLIHELVIDEGGVYSTLFGNETDEVLRKVNINWIIPKTLDKSELKDIVRLMLDYFIAEILKCYETEDLLEYEPVTYNYEVLKEDNKFVQSNYAFSDDTRFADLENYLDDSLSIHDDDHFTYMKFNFPVYNIGKEVYTFN